MACKSLSLSPLALVFFFLGCGPTVCAAGIETQAPTPAQELKSEAAVGTKSADPVRLPFRSRGRADWFVEVAVWRYICPGGYAEIVAGQRVACGDGGVKTKKDQVPEEFVEEWSRRRAFVRTVAEGATQTLELVTVPAPAGGFEVHLLGRARSKNGDEPHPDLAGLQAKLASLLVEILKAPLGQGDDGLLAYQLSYVQADRAVAILRTLGYPVIEYVTKKPDGSSTPFQTVFDNNFVELSSLAPAGGTLTRPVVIKLVDSETTTLVGDKNPFSGGGTNESELTGGQKLGSVTDGAPQQRLLIVFDEKDRTALDVLLSRLQKYIDVPARQILIEALVIELQDSRVLDLGVDFKGSQDNYGASFEEKDGVIQPFVFNFTRPLPSTLLDFTAKLRALVDGGRAKVLSRPSVFVLDGRQAKINVGDNVPYTANLSVSNGVVTTSTEFLKTGIILNLRPRAASDNSEITFQVETIVSSAGVSRVVPNSGVLIAPTVQSRQVQTLVRVANDTPFVIGGLISQTDQKKIVGIPGLSEIPLLGRLFRKENTLNDKREVIIVITPHIVASADPTFTYSVARDTQGEETEGYEKPTVWRGLRGPGDGKLCRKDDKGPVFATARRDPERIETGSIFDSFESQLFRNVYRLRSSDIFDLTFLQEQPEIQKTTRQVQELAREITPASFTSRPRIDPRELEKELRGALQKLRCREGQCPSEEAERAFLTVFDGGMLGEEILVNNMLIRILERLGFQDLVPLDHLILFSQSKRKSQADRDGFDDPDYLAEVEGVAECLQKNRTLVIGFPPASATGEPTDDEAAKKRFEQACLPEGFEELVESSKRANARSERFSPPITRLYCADIENATFVDQLRACNLREQGRWTWQAILLNRSYCESRKRDPISLLQGVLALKRLLELNDTATFPRTLKAFHVGREIVFPTREGLQEKRHLLDRRTAALFYETLDYYHAFGELNDQLAKGLEPVAAQQEDGKAQGKPPSRLEPSENGSTPR